MTPDRHITVAKGHRRAAWELYWMRFHEQSRLETFRNIVVLGFTRRAAAEMIHDCEREG